MRPILIVDDSRVTRRVLRNTLADCGLAPELILEAADGDEALAMLEDLDYEVALVFCDLYMPGRDGLGFLDELSSRGVLGSFPVVVLTSDSRKELAAEVVRRGASTTLSKPASAGMIASVLRESLPAAASEAAGPGGGPASP
jgi:CheY-like chemotaxis protein